MEVSKSASRKQLKEHLQHQQEPFSLHNYISERRFFLKNFSSGDDIIDDYHHHLLLPPEKTLKWGITYEKHKFRKRFFHASSILRSLLYRFVPFGDGNQNHQKLSTNWVGAIDAASDDDRYTNEDGEEADGLICHGYSPKRVNMFHSFTLPEFRRLQADAGAKPNWISTVDKQWEQPLANSVREFKSDEGGPFFSTYLPKLLQNSNIRKFRRQKRDKLHHHPHHGVVHRSKRTQQGPFGRVEKGREFPEYKGKRERIWLQEKLCSREAEKIRHLLHADSCVVSQEWTNLQRPSRDIHYEIADAIMVDILKEILSILVNNYTLL